MRIDRSSRSAGNLPTPASAVSTEISRLTSWLSAQQHQACASTSSPPESQIIDSSQMHADSSHRLSTTPPISASTSLSPRYRPLKKTHIITREHDFSPSGLAEPKAWLRPRRCAVLPRCGPADPASLRTAVVIAAENFRVVALAAVLLAHSPAFRRFDEILYLVEKASDLTLPDFVRCDSCRNSPPPDATTVPASPLLTQSRSPRRTSVPSEYFTFGARTCNGTTIGFLPSSRPSIKVDTRLLH
jgi:hypothetical protein